MAVDTAHIVDFTLPSLGSDMEQGTVLTWLVEPGDHVSKGDVLLRVDTEKAEIDVEVWHEATVVELLVEPGDTVPVGTPLARLESGATPATTTTPPPAPVPAPTVAGTDTGSAVVMEPVKPAVPAPGDPVVASKKIDQPVTHDAAVNTAATPRLVYWPSPTGQSTISQPSPSTQKPSLPEGESQLADRVPAVRSADPKASRAERRQAAVAALMERSNNEIPHFHLARELDVTATLAWLEAHNNSVPPPERILPAALMLYAVAQAAVATPINGTFDQGPVDAEHVDLGVAVHVRGGGLMTPVVPQADTLALDSLMSELQAVVGRARASRLSTRDMTAATLTVTNLGDSGVDSVLGVIRPPERALVGFGRIAERPVAIDGEVTVRTTVQVTLSADHRVINGQTGARFLDAIDNILSNPTEITFAGATSDD